MKLACDSTSHHLELEIDRGRSGVKMYVNLLLLPIAPLPGDETRASIQIILEDDEILVIHPHRFIGGQRLLLPPDTSDLLISLLLEGCSFTIKVGRNELQVIGNNFEKSYNDLMSLEIG
jgi:hypothetical protein